jgi:hypothetical protein
MSKQIVGDALRTWQGYDPFIGAASNGWDALMADQVQHVGPFLYTSQAVIAYTLEVRAKLINDWMAEGDEGGRTNEQIMNLSPSVEDMTWLNTVVATHNLDQVFRYLYLHSYLLDYLDIPSPWVDMVAIRDNMIPL